MGSVSTSFRVPAPLKREFEKKLKEFPDYATSTEFFHDAMRALIHQIKRGDKIQYPLEFVVSRKPPPGSHLHDVRLVLNEPSPEPVAAPAAQPAPLARVTRARSALRSMQKKGQE